MQYIVTRFYSDRSSQYFYAKVVEATTPGNAILQYLREKGWDEEDIPNEYTEDFDSEIVDSGDLYHVFELNGTKCKVPRSFAEWED